MLRLISDRLRHADPAFTLRTYVHLLDEGLGDAEFLDDVVTSDPSRVNAGSTERPQTAADENARERLETAA